MNNSRQWFYLAAMLFSLVFLYFLGDVLVPFLVAALIAYLTNPLQYKTTIFILNNPSGSIKHKFCMISNFSSK